MTCARPAATAYTDVSHQASEPRNLAGNLCRLGPGWEGGAAPVGRLAVIAPFSSSPLHRALRIPRSGPPESCCLHRTRWWQTSKETAASADLPSRQKASSTRVDRERNRPLRYPSVRLCGHVPPTITREGKGSFRAGGLAPSEASVRNMRTRGDVAGSTSATATGILESKSQASGQDRTHPEGCIASFLLHETALQRVDPELRKPRRQKGERCRQSSRRCFEP